MKRALLPLTCAGVLVGTQLMATGMASAAVCTTSATDGGCGPYSYAPQITSSNGSNTYISNDVWNNIDGTSQTLTATDPGNWSVISNVPAGNTAVVSYPDTQQLYGDNGTFPTIDNYSSLTSSFAESYGTLQPGLMSEAAYDIWANNWSNEIMVWVDNHGQSLDYDTNLGSATIAGQSWTVYKNGSSELIVALDGAETSGTVDIKATLGYLETQGDLPASSTLTAIDFGPEFSSTGGQDQTYAQTCFTISENVSNQACPGQQIPAVTADAATNIAKESATVSGTVNPEGSGTTYQVDYGTSTHYGSSVPASAVDAGSGNSPVNVSENLIGLEPNTTYHYRIRATNSGGMTYSADQTFTTAGLGTVSVWNEGTPTGSSMYNDWQPLNLGLRFHSSENGYITGMRFYKQSDDTRTTHQVTLWDSNGNELTSGTTSSESASGWQEADFATPVAITAGQTYTASYQTGVYTSTPQGLSSAVTNGPLTAEASGGVYAYGSTATYPTSTYANSNYWVDVSFSPQYTLWDDTATPSNAVDSNDPSSVNVGTKFTVKQSGYITGIRFYKYADNTGTHQGALWDSSGTMLTSGAFTGETASGWQELDFASPIAVTAGQTYTASYLAPAGHYAYTPQGLASPSGNATLSAVASGGVYVYGDSQAYPTSTYNSNNYWVDVIYGIK